jgi:hypothetical protein
MAISRQEALANLGGGDLGLVLLADHDFSADGVVDYLVSPPATIAGMTPTYSTSGTTATWGTDGSTGLVHTTGAANSGGAVRFPFSEIAGLMTRSPAVGDRWAFCMEWVASTFTVDSTSTRLDVLNAAGDNGALGGHWKVAGDTRRVVRFVGGFQDAIRDATAAISMAAWLGVNQTEWYSANASLDTTAPPSASGPFLVSMSTNESESTPPADWDPVAESGSFQVSSDMRVGEAGANTIKRFQVWLQPGSAYTP